MKKFIAEFIGTFALVFCGTGAVIIDQLSGGSLGLLGISATFGITITAMIYIFGSSSGAHINPAVTIGLAFGKLFPKNKVLTYISAQFLGAISASLLLSQLFTDTISLGETTPSGTILQSFSIELLLTFFLMLTILAVTSKKEFSTIAGLIIGLLVTGIIIFAGPISGGSFNPARSFSPAIISGNLSMIWIYLTAPTLGAILATFVWKVFDKME
jgi:MIP family channel proteins